MLLAAVPMLGLVLGGVAGYRGGWVDALLSRAADAWAAIPLLLGGVVVLTSTERRGILEVSLVLAPSASRRCSASAFAGVVIAAEASLTYIGTGLQQPTVSWGLMLLRSQDRITQAPHLMVFPAPALVFTVLGFVLLGEGLRRRTPPGG